METKIKNKSNADGRKNIVGVRNSPEPSSELGKFMRITWLHSGHTILGQHMSENPPVTSVVQGNGKV